MDKRAIARIVVGNHWGTGFLVSDRRVLTALHVIADLQASKTNRRVILYPGEITLRFGDPQTATWAPAGAARLVSELYSIVDDWAVLELDGDAPADVAPLVLADLSGAREAATWHTFGFPTVAQSAGINLQDGKISAWEPERPRLQLANALPIDLPGLSGAPCVVDGGAVALIQWAILDDANAYQGELFATSARKIADGARGRLPFSEEVKWPFEDEVSQLLSATNEAALRGVATRLRLAQHGAIQVARGLLGAGLDVVAGALRLLGVTGGTRAEIVDMAAAAKLHNDAVVRLAEATKELKPGFVRASSQDICTWYTRRATHHLARDVWGHRLLHIDLAGHEETGGDPVDAVLALIRARAATQWTRRRTFLAQALAGNLNAPFCVALHNEHRVEVVVELRRRLPNAHVLMVHPGELVLDEADDRIALIAPHVEDEDALLLAYETVCTTTDP
jgi:hypothetical protein